MARELITSLIDLFKADATILANIGVDANGDPVVTPYHGRNPTQERTPFPRLTVCRFGSGSGVQQGRFDDQSDFQQAMDQPRIAICAWSTASVDEAYLLNNRVDTLLRGPTSVRANIATQYFSPYRIKRTAFRDDLFDPEEMAFHIHAEYELWIMSNIPFGVTQPY